MALQTTCDAAAADQSAAYVSNWSKHVRAFVRVGGGELCHEQHIGLPLHGAYGRHVFIWTNIKLLIVLTAAAAAAAQSADAADVQQTSNKLPANVFKIHVLIAGRLLDRVNTL